MFAARGDLGPNFGLSLGELQWGMPARRGRTHLWVKDDHSQRRQFFNALRYLQPWEFMH
jgi:hypothetical protein